MIVTFLMVSMSSIIMQSLGEIELRAPAVCAKMWCLSTNGSERTSLCTPKVIQKVNFSKYLWGFCTPDGLQLCTYIAIFLWSQMAPQQTAKFRTGCFWHWHFRSILRKDSVANYGSIWTLFPPSVRGLHVLYNALNVSYFRW